jgi:arylsulfatase A-like enzyme
MLQARLITPLALLALCGCPRGNKIHATPRDAAVVQPIASAVVTDAAPPSSGGIASPPKDLNVILVSVDSLRADMPWAGYERPIAPNLTALEKRAVSYARAYSISSYTSMSVGGLLGGKLPGELRRDGYFFGTYTKDNVFFPELLQREKIRTMAAHAHAYFRSSAGFQQGFDKWEMVPNLQFDETTDKNITSPQLEGIAEKMLGDPANDEARFFAWFHFMDPHDEYFAHPGDGGVPSWGTKLRDVYDTEVTFTDKYIGKLLEYVETKPWAKRTAIVITADHGEALGEHGQYKHGFELYEPLVRVPLFFVVPGAQPRRIDEPRSALDLAPTLCELFGVSPDEGFEGKSLVAELYGAPAEPRDVPLDLPATSDNGRRRALVHGNLKMLSILVDSQLQLFDLEKDPGEKEPLRKGEVFDDMAARYRAFAKGVKDVKPFACGDDCLNGAYKTRDSGVPSE